MIFLATASVCGQGALHRADLRPSLRAAGLNAGQEAHRTCTGRSRGARACRSRHVSGAVRCLRRVGARYSRQEAWLPLLWSLGSGGARQALRCDGRFFARVACDDPAWLVARRELAQHAPRIVWSLAWPSGMACRAGAGRHGCDGALSTTSAMTAGSLIAAAPRRRPMII